MSPEIPEGSFLGRLDAGLGRLLREQASSRTYRPGAALFHMDQGADEVIVLLSGRVKIFTVSREGRETILAIREAGDIVGEMAVLGGRVRNASAEALREANALIIPADAFEKALRAEPGLALALLEEFAVRLGDSDAKRREYGDLDVTGRVASRVLEMAERFGEGEGDAIVIEAELTQEDLAAWTGGSREAVSNALTTLRKAGWLKTARRRITVLDAEALRSRTHD